MHTRRHFTPRNAVFFRRLRCRVDGSIARGKLILLVILSDQSRFTV